MLSYVDREEFDPRTQIDYEAGSDNDIKGSECSGCHKLYTFRSGMFNRNSAMKLGYNLLCVDCEKAPKLSMAEHVSRLTQMNFNSEGTRRQRSPDQEDLKGERPGKPMDCSLFLQKLLHIFPYLYVTQGGYYEDLALYATSGVDKPEWGGNSFKYMGYVTLGVMPEYSLYEFDTQRDVLLRAKQIGWRSVLLRFVENGILTEAQCSQEFGPPSGGVNSIWYKKLYRHRNAKKLA